MAFDNIEETEMVDEVEAESAGGAPEESGNRTFIIIAIILGAVMVLSLACIAIFGVATYLPKVRARNTEQAIRMAQNTALAFDATQTAVAGKKPTITPTSPPPTNTPLPPTNTPVVVQAQASSTPTVDGRTATVAALLTQAAKAQLTPTQPTSTLLPQGGFADEVRSWGMGLGLPGLLGLALVFIAIIFLARKLRTS